MRYFDTEIVQKSFYKGSYLGEINFPVRKCSKCSDFVYLEILTVITGLNDVYFLSINGMIWAI